MCDIKLVLNVQEGYVYSEPLSNAGAQKSSSEIMSVVVLNIAWQVGGI